MKATKICRKVRPGTFGKLLCEMRNDIGGNAMVISETDNFSTEGFHGTLDALIEDAYELGWMDAEETALTYKSTIPVALLDTMGNIVLEEVE